MNFYKTQNIKIGKYISHSIQFIVHLSSVREETERNVICIFLLRTGPNLQKPPFRRVKFNFKVEKKVYKPDQHR